MADLGVAGLARPSILAMEISIVNVMSAKVVLFLEDCMLEN